MKTTEDKRFARHNEEKIMESLDSIKDSLSKQDVSIAVIKTKAEATEEHLKILNGKVLAHESRLQSQEGVAALSSEAIKTLLEERKQSKTFWERNWEKGVWFLIACGWAFLIAKK